MGLHLDNEFAHEEFRRSAVAVADGSGRLVGLDLAHEDDAVLALIPGGVGLIVIDAPITVPNDDGQRDIERLLAWCDAPAFPTSRERLTKLYGGLRGETLASRLADRGPMVETPPDLVLRQLAWEREHGSTGSLDLGDYRRRYLEVRAPRFRPRGRGRAAPGDSATAAALLTEGIDLRGWTLATAPDDRGAIEDAARLDAIAALVAAHRAAHLDHRRSMVLASKREGPYVLPVDEPFRERLTVNLDRLRSEGAVAIRESPPGSWPFRR